MVRYLSEMPWFPIAFLGENITWQAVDDHSADVTFTDAGRSVTGRMFFDDEGRQPNFVAMRYREINGEFSLDRWTTPVTGYGVRAGLNIGCAGRWSGSFRKVTCSTGMEKSQTSNTTCRGEAFLVDRLLRQ